VQADSCFVPTTLEGGERDAEDVCRLLLAQAFVEEEVDDFLLVFGKAFHLAVKVLPLCEVFGLIGPPVERSADFVRSLTVRVVVSSLAVCPEVVLLEVQQLTTDLGASQVEEMTNGLQFHGVQGPIEADEAPLEDVIGQLPTP
jgi:hypothetical protein